MPDQFSSLSFLVLQCCLGMKTVYTKTKFFSLSFVIFFLDEPDDVRLRPNITNSTICAEYTVNFTCSADANPAVDSYTLFKNGSVVNTSSLGVWSITINTAGQFVYRCEANNSVGSGKSSDVTLNVEGEVV